MKYASVYTRRKRGKTLSRYYVSYWDPNRQKRVFEATVYRVDDAQGYRRALDYANDKSKEAKADKEVGGDDRWERWAEVFLQDRYRGRAKTLSRYLGAWVQWTTFLHERKLRVPRALDYNAVLGFVSWRSSQVKKSSGKRVSRNTALCDVKVMSVVMREALRRGYAETNHCEKLGVQKDPAKQKPEIQDHEVARIRVGLATKAEWMGTAFEIALHQGCRLSETSIPLECVDLARRTIMFSAKGRGGGQKHEFTTKLHPALVPLMSQLKNSGKAVTCKLPVMAAKDFHFFFQEIGLPHLCFHCTRVTAITRMARAGVPISQAMSFVGHASQTIHRIYQRLAAADLTLAVEAISYGEGNAKLQIRDDVQASRLLVAV